MICVRILLCGAFLAAVLAFAETPKQATAGSTVSYTATSANVSGAPDAIRIDILRWSTEAERDRLMDAWMLKTTNTGRGGRAAGGRGGARGGRAGRGAAANNPVAKPTPEGTLATALKGSPTVGYVWSREVAGYAIRYAGKIANPDGSERIVLITERRLGAVNDLWKPTGAEALPYDFSVIELHVKGSGPGEGKTSLTGKVALDTSLKMLGLENYDTLPVVLAHVKQKAE
ncbi:MAG TPA: hypothetical protein VHY84_07480 [Bryobacteraceae bacterium]|jgi:hypothetical protein|nr:hypothetical protein [Bryobacteraceae bacterium]